MWRVRNQNNNRMTHVGETQHKLGWINKAKGSQRAQKGNDSDDDGNGSKIKGP